MTFLRKILLIAIAVAVNAQLNASDRPEVVLHQFHTDARDSDIEAVLYLVGGLELVEYGLSSTRTAGTVDYVIATEYSTRDGVIHVRYRLHRADAPDAEIATEQFFASVDENFDHSVSRAVRDLVIRSGINATPTHAASIDGIVPDFAGTAIGVVPREEPDPGAFVAPIDLERGDFPSAGMRFSLVTAFGSAIWIGEISRLFRFGAGGSFVIGAVKPRSTFEIEFGAKLAAFRLFPDDGVVGGDLYVATAGPRGGIATHGDHAATVGLHGSAGLAVITIVRDEERLAKSVPYADIGVKSSVAVSRNVSIGFELEFLSVFERNSAIMGIPFGFTVAVRL